MLFMSARSRRDWLWLEANSELPEQDALRCKLHEAEDATLGRVNRRVNVALRRVDRVFVAKHVREIYLAVERENLAAII
jgi:endonuclease/exonuclease/phosphatase family metal-dependent hydrolase